MKNNIISECIYAFRTHKKMCKKAFFICFVLSSLCGSSLAMLLYDKEIYISGLFYRWIVDGKGFTGILLFLFYFAFFRILLSMDFDTEEDVERNFLKANKGFQGTASFMTEEEKLETFHRGDIYEIEGDIIGEDKDNPGQLLSLIEGFGVNKSYVLMGAPGSGKTFCFIIPLLLQIIRRGESAIVNDPKGELFKNISEIAKKYGYKVRILNTIASMIHNSDSINFLGHIRGDDIAATSKAQSLANAIINNLTVEKGFWVDGAKNLLTAIMMFIALNKDYKESEKNFATLYSIITTNTVKKLEEMFEDLPDNHPAKNPFNKFAQAETAIKGNTLAGLGYYMNVFDDPELRKIIKGNDSAAINLKDPGREKCMYFITNSSKDSSRDFIVALFYEIMFQELESLVHERENGAMPNKVNLILEEFKNSGRINDFEKRLSVIRSEGYSTLICLQDVNQLKEWYPDDRWRTVLNDCDVFILMKTTDESTLSFFNTLIGKHTAMEKSKRYNENVIDPIKTHGEYTVTERETQRDLMYLDELRRINIEEMLVVVSNKQPIIVKKYKATSHPLYNEIVKVLPMQHYPLWRLIEDKIVDEDFDYDGSPSFILPKPKEDEVIIEKPIIPILEKISAKKIVSRDENFSIRKSLIKILEKFADEEDGGEILSFDEKKIYEEAVLEKNISDEPTKEFIQDIPHHQRADAYKSYQEPQVIKKDDSTYHSSKKQNDIQAKKEDQELLNFSEDDISQDKNRNHTPKKPVFKPVTSTETEPKTESSRYKKLDTNDDWVTDTWSENQFVFEEDEEDEDE